MGVRVLLLTVPWLTHSTINNPEFENDIFWAADGLSGEIPDRRQVRPTVWDTISNSQFERSDGD